MDCTMNERVSQAAKVCLESDEKNPVRLFGIIAALDCIRIHGPEHHFIDGACILTAFRNSGGEINLEEGLNWLYEQTVKMPGGMCGHWGVCGAVTGIGAALSFIDKTGPLSGKDWGKHMKFTSDALSRLSKTGGPRCCKRDAYFAFSAAVQYINENYDVTIPPEDIKCSFSRRNEQCLKKACPFYEKDE